MGLRLPWQRRALACQQFVELLTAYLDGALPRRLHTALDAHLMKCEECTEYFEQFQRSIALTGQLPDDDVPADLFAALDDVFGTTFGSPLIDNGDHQ